MDIFISRLSLRRAFAYLLWCALALSIGTRADEKVCSEAEGNYQHELGNWTRAYQLLRGCELRDDVGGITLYRLADHIGLGGHGVFRSAALRRFKKTGLYFRSALFGYRPGVVRIAEELERREELVNDKTSGVIARCLRSTLDIQDERRASIVKGCMLKKEFKGGRDK